MANYKTQAKLTEKSTTAIRATKNRSWITRVAQQSSGSISSAGSGGTSAVRAHAAGDGAVISTRDHNGKPLQKVVKNQGCSGTLSDGDRRSDAMQDSPMT